MYIIDQINGYKAKTSKGNVNKDNKKKLKRYSLTVLREAVCNAHVLEFTSINTLLQTFAA